MHVQIFQGKFCIALSLQETLQTDQNTQPAGVQLHD